MFYTKQGKNTIFYKDVRENNITYLLQKNISGRDGYSQFSLLGFDPTYHGT